MKKISTILIVMLAFVASTYAQKVNKFGFLSSAELISLMPESSKAEAQLDVLGRELADLEKRISDFQQSAQDKIDAKREKLYEPILQKANDGIKAVAKANGYTYIFDSSAGMLLFADESDDVMPLVKSHLKLPNPKPAANAPK